jgi:hypothetical protein
MPLILQNFLLFQAGWFACVVGGASRDYTWAGAAVVAVIVAVHLARANNIRNETLLILLTAAVGTAWDSGLMIAGLFTFHNGVVVSGIVPAWMIAMWVLFATTLNVSMRWMKGKYLLAAIFGAIGGPIAYYAGHRLGAVDFNDTQMTMIAVSVGWSVIMPTLMVLTTRFNGYQDIQPTRYQVKLT